jgi:hypothetical protein
MAISRNKTYNCQYNYFQFLISSVTVWPIGNDIKVKFDKAFINLTRPAWAGFKTAEEGRTKIM